MTSSAATGVTPIQDSFRALVNTVPDLSAASYLRIAGQIECPTPAWSGELKPAPQNSSPTVLTLDLVATQSSDTVPDVVVRKLVALDVTPPPAGVTEVEVRSDGTSFTFPVQTLGEVVADKSAVDQAAIQTALADIQAKS